MINYKIIENKLRKIIENNLIEKNDKILIAFSGGPDSVFLYYILKYLQNDFNLEISLLYVNHNLREDVEKDLNFVKSFSEENEVSLYIESVNVKENSKINKKSIELSARELRYKKLSEVYNKIKYNKIATGHNLDDNVETLIFRLLRGTSIKGLKSIPQKRNEIIRPILNYEKKEILSFLNKNSQNYITDYTNEENGYTRNYIRNKLFPMFSEINPSFRKKVNELIIEINKSEKSNCKNKNKERIILLMEKDYQLYPFESFVSELKIHYSKEYYILMKLLEIVMKDCQEAKLGRETVKLTLSLMMNQKLRLKIFGF